MALAYLVTDEGVEDNSAARAGAGAIPAPLRGRVARAPLPSGKSPRGVASTLGRQCRSFERVGPGVHGVTLLQ
ncbi:MAG: hypothetical protein M3O36_09190, partial [Myxococcota bacterium]|nr:hypothetical protein [Myxococcota bacterium]